MSSGFIITSIVVLSSLIAYICIGYGYLKNKDYWMTFWMALSFGIILYMYMNVLAVPQYRHYELKKQSIKFTVDDIINMAEDRIKEIDAEIEFIEDEIIKRKEQSKHLQ